MTASTPPGGNCTKLNSTIQKETSAQGEKCVDVFVALQGKPKKKRFNCEITVSEAGGMGGRAVLRVRGREHFSKIGVLGQKAMRAKFPNSAREWGRLRGRPRKNSLNNYGK